VNSDLALLQPYPFEKLRQLFAGVAPAPALCGPSSTFKEIKLSIGEPQHETPPFIKKALADNLAGLANYPTTQGSDALRQSIAAWIGRRYGVPAPDAATQVLPVNGSREALFAFAQTVIDRARPNAKVVCPNPFYQIYEGAALLAGAQPVYLNTVAHTGFAMEWAELPESTWREVQLVYVCSPGNPTGKVMGLDDMEGAVRAFRPSRLRHRVRRVLFRNLLRREANHPWAGWPPPRNSAASDYRNLVMFSSLSKRSNVPGLRSGFVAGDAAILKQVPALPHLPRKCHEPGGAIRQYRRLEGRGPCARQPPHVRREIP
jgi:N-succinyldiaminopimelate aminotransferase